MAGACGGATGGGGGEFMLFGVRVVVDAMRKSVSLNNLSQYEQPQALSNNANNQNLTDAKESGGGNNNSNNRKDDSSSSATAAAGYASADDAVHHSTGSRGGERKRGVPWTEEEHKLFLLGLQKVGKGDWRGISRNFVKTRTPTQVASHAQKYFLRRSNLNRRRRRSSLFDITTDTVISAPMELEQEHAHQQDKKNGRDSSCSRPSLPESGNISNFHPVAAMPITANPVMLPVPMESPVESLTLGQGIQAVKPPAAAKLIRPIPVLPDSHPSAMSDLDLNLTSTIHPSSLSLRLSLTSDQMEPSSRHSAFQAMPSFSNGDSIISVA